jgi:vacuolar-type H+-ATPase subunit D/Vma8
MESTTLANANELQELERRLKSEIDDTKRRITPLHNSVFNHFLERKIVPMNWTLETRVLHKYYTSRVGRLD